MKQALNELLHELTWQIILVMFLMSWSLSVTVFACTLTAMAKEIRGIKKHIGMVQ